MCKDEGPEGEAQSRVEKGRSAVGFNESSEKQEKSEYQIKYLYYYTVLPASTRVLKLEILA